MGLTFRSSEQLTLGRLNFLWSDIPHIFFISPIYNKSPTCRKPWFTVPLPFPQKFRNNCLVLYHVILLDTAFKFGFTLSGVTKGPADPTVRKNIWDTTFASGGAKKAVAGEGGGGQKSTRPFFIYLWTQIFRRAKKILRGAPTGNVTPLFTLWVYDQYSGYRLKEQYNVGQTWTVSSSGQ